LNCPPTSHGFGAAGTGLRAVAIAPKIFNITVQRFVAVGAHGDEVQFVVVALLAPQFFVVDMEISSGPTELASPTIAAENLFSELIVRFGIKSQARPLRSNAVHEAFSVTSSSNACRCSPGRNLKNRDMDCSSAVGSSLSTFAPARKSAQIISRQ